MKFAMIRMSMLTLAVATGWSCGKKSKSKKGDDRLTAPAADNVIPGSFKNTAKDESAFKKKLPDTVYMLNDSKESFALRSRNQPSKKYKNFANSLLQTAIGRMGLSAETKQSISNHTTGLLKMGIGSESSYDYDYDYDDEIQEDSAEISLDTSVLDDIKELNINDDCTPLLSSLTSTYDSALSSYRSSVNQIAATDFTKAEGFSKDAVKSPQEAFAYNFVWSSDTAKGPDGKPVGQQMQGLKLAVNGRFSGGSNDTAIALMGNADVAASLQQGSLKLASNLNTYADIAAQTMDLGIGVNVAAAGKDSAGKPVNVAGNIKLQAGLKGGTLPAQTFSVQGTFTANQESHSVDLNVSLAKKSEQVMVLAIAGKADKESIRKIVTMTIAKDYGGYGTCSVASIDP